jgi:CheY-like chemotaxis protein
MKNVQVLLVDDEPDFLEIMGNVINGWGYGLLKASGGRKAIELIKSARPDVVVLDYMMPDMDGVATLKEIRGFDAKIPVIMFTAYPDIKVLKGTEKFHISAFIPKLSTYSDVALSLKAAIDMVIKNAKKQE